MKDCILYDDEDLMHEIKVNNMFAFDILYKKYSKRLFKFGYSLLKSQDETEDLIQNVFLILWQHRYQIEKDASIKSYIFTIAYNSAISVLREKTKKTQFIEYLKSIQEINMEPVNEELEYNELTSKAEAIIKSLPQRQREVYLLHRVIGLKYNEIAGRLGISHNTVENHMSRALKTIREKLVNYSFRAILFWYFLFY